MKAVHAVFGVLFFLLLVNVSHAQENSDSTFTSSVRLQSIFKSCVDSFAIVKVNLEDIEPVQLKNVSNPDVTGEFAGAKSILATCTIPLTTLNSSKASAIGVIDYSIHNVYFSQLAGTCVDVLVSVRNQNIQIRFDFMNVPPNWKFIGLDKVAAEVLHDYRNMTVKFSRTATANR